MKWLKVYGLPRLPLFLARLAMRLGIPGPSWYKWKAASAGSGIILNEMIRAANDLGYDGQKVGQLAMSRIGEKQGTDLREQLGLSTMEDTVDAVRLASRFFDLQVTLSKTENGEYILDADRCPWFGGEGHEGVRDWDVDSCDAFAWYEKSMVGAINPNVKLSHTEMRSKGGHTCRGIYQLNDKAPGDDAEGIRANGKPDVQPEMIQLGKKPGREPVRVGEKSEDS